MPKVVYKFYGPERTDVLSSFRVRFSQLAALNDPFEFAVNANEEDLREGAEKVAARATRPWNMLWTGLIQTIKTVLNNEIFKSTSGLFKFFILIFAVPIFTVIWLLLTPFISIQLKKIMSAAASEFSDLFAQLRDGLITVFSCSETWHSVPMWAHYAANHRGFVIGVNPEIAIIPRGKKRDDPYFRPRKVHYLKRIPSLKKSTMDLGDFIASKMVDWAYEKEWRFVGFVEDAAERGTYSDGFEVVLFDLNPASIREVIFGAACSVEVAIEIIEKLSQAGISPELYQVRTGPGYGFERHRIMSVSDFVPAPVRPSKVPSLGEREFTQMFAAVEEFQRDAANHPIAGKLLGRSRQ